MDAIPRDYDERCLFDAFCKTVLRNEAQNCFRDMKRRRDREVSLGSLSQTDLDKLFTVDHYPSLYFRPMAVSFRSATGWWPLPLPACPSRDKAS